MGNYVQATMSVHKDYTHEGPSLHELITTKEFPAGLKGDYMRSFWHPEGSGDIDCYVMLAKWADMHLIADWFKALPWEGGGGSLSMSDDFGARVVVVGVDRVVSDVRVDYS